MIDSYDAPAMTRQFMEHFYSGDADWLSLAMSDDFVGIGAQQDQFKLNRRDVLSNCVAMPRVIIVNPDFRLISKSGGVRVVDGEYQAFVSPSGCQPGQGMAFAANQRISALWRETGDGLRMFHLHLSNPMTQVTPGERFPEHFSRNVMWYLDLMGRQRQSDGQAEVVDVDGVDHILALSDVAAIEAKRQDVLIHCEDETLRVHEGITRLTGRIGVNEDNGFVQVHRSFWVNALYVRSVDEEYANLSCGLKVPIARRRRNEILGELRRVRREDDRKVRAAAVGLS